MSGIQYTDVKTDIRVCIKSSDGKVFDQSYQAERDVEWVCTTGLDGTRIEIVMPHARVEL